MSKELSEEQKEALEQLKDRILQFVGEQEKPSVEVSDISQGLDSTGSKAFKKMINAIAELEREGRIVLTQDGKFKLRDAEPVMQGVFSGTDRGFGFVPLEEFEEDIFIPPSETNSALNGDLVTIEVTKEAIPWKGKGPVGKVLEVVERATTTLIGEFHAYTDDEVANSGLFGYIKTQSKKIPSMKMQITDKGIRPVEGSIVQAEILKYPRSSEEDMVGFIIRTIGHKDEPGIEILTIVNKYDIPSEFPDEVIKEAEAVPDQIAPEDLKGRKDLRDEVIITIDGADAKDLDDAVVVKKLPNGNFHLGVHIADVSHYVKEDSPMDQEAFERGTSVYLTDRVIPMLPQRLSNGICSLHPNVDRLTLSCEMEIDQSGDVVSYDVFPSVIRSFRRMTYTAVNEILTDKNPETLEEHADLVDLFEKMGELHHILEKKRENRGSIDFDTREAKIEVDPEGMPVDILVRERGVGERLIESFMLAANETVSEYYAKQSLPILYRIHARPDEAKMQRFLEFVSSFGINVKGTKDSVSPLDLQAVMNEVKGKPEETVVSMLMLRSMQQAKYDVDPIGHYGLAAEYYSHFTSPIRRYPDLILHRLIHFYDEVGKDQKARKRWEKRLPEIAEHSSKTERRAVDAERETDELKKTEFMAGKIGEEFEGIVTSVTNFGMFVQLENTVEGLVHISKMDDDYYEFNERGLILVGRRTGRIFKIGEPVKVKLTAANLEGYQIDFELADLPEGEKLKQAKRNHGNKGNQKSNGNGRNRSTKRSQQTDRNKQSSQKRTTKKKRSGKRKG
ncbi:ribonuclease R [Marinilactibacillus kalidii]|uniref:ribonuclease R n=1 Tax=Marinilactibacillus kalidii TaxID=2820274 RepID=UPI001ABECC4D|nr:ribonuclease R [Marinilactibacillus kalidii]